MKTITDVATGINLVSNVNYNARGQVISYTQGNGNIVNNSFNNYGYITNKTYGPTNSRMQFTYCFDPQTQNLDSRSFKNFATNTTQTEYFSYDNLDRLTAWTVNGTTFNTNYNANGNIAQKTDMGFYSYNSQKPYAVSAISELSGSAISSRDCHVTYNMFNKVKQITLKNDLTQLHNNTIVYGPDNQRRVMYSTNTDRPITV